MKTAKIFSKKGERKNKFEFEIHEKLNGILKNSHQQPFMMLTGILLAVVVILGAFSWYLFQEYQKTQKLIKNPSIIAQKETKEITDKVSQLMQLPNEKPTLATVQDVKKLKNQTFFARAQNGDKVLIFVKAKKAVLYRPQIHKIIEVGTIDIGQTTQDTGTPLPTIPQRFENVTFPSLTPTPGFDGQGGP